MPNHEIGKVPTTKFEQWTTPTPRTPFSSYEVQYILSFAGASFSSSRNSFTLFT